RPLVIGSAAIGVVHVGAAIVPGTDTPLTFHGRPGSVIPPGAEAASDAVRLHVRPLQRLAVSVFLPQPTGAPTQHTHAHQINYVAAGDHATDSQARAFSVRTPAWYFVTDVEVARSTRFTGSIVAIGDSITDGVGSQEGANARWPNDLARRLDARHGRTLSVVD